MNGENQREASRREWRSTGTVVDINSGSLQRIADATEIMARNFVQLQNDRDMYKRWYTTEQGTTKKLRRAVSAYQGILNKKKKKK